jgi:hypothetical protein
MARSTYAPSNHLFDWVIALFAGLWAFGAYIDGWAHIHLEDSLETFFTPWHAIFYFGMLATAVSMGIMALRNREKGYPLKYVLPKEYLFAFTGVVISIVAGAGDMTWHYIFGIENDVEALLSPTHLLLAIGSAIAVSGPLYAIWYRHKTHPIYTGPTVLSTLYFMSVITFMLQFLNPFILPWMADSLALRNEVHYEFVVALGVANTLFFTVLFIGIILSTIRHWHYPFGSFTIILGLNVAGMTLMQGAYYYFIITALVAGLFVDLAYWLLIKKNGKIHHVHIFSFVAPFMIFALYMATIQAVDKLVWSVHLWTGLVFMAGVIGYLVSYLVIPSRGK